MSGLQSAKISERIDWAPGLMSLVLDVSADFVPGQFFNLGLPRGDTVVRRSYSAASSPNQPLQFLVSHVESGELTPALFELKLDGELLLDRTPLGFFTMKEVPATKRLWLVATGTGLGPYLSMLRAGELDERFDEVNIIHGVRSRSHLAHEDELLLRTSENAHIRYVPVLSGASEEVLPKTHLAGRITTVWDSGMLESVCGPFDRDCHMLLCGNPQMIENMVTRLKERGFEKHRRRTPGHFNFEKYW